MNGKAKCKYLKSLRKSIADKNGIPLNQRECTFEGECKGTCPHCEAEVRYIEEQLERKKKFGKAAVAVAMSATMMLAASGTPDVVPGDMPYEGPTEEVVVPEGVPPEYPPEDVEIIEPLEGDVAYEDIEEPTMGEPADYTPEEEPVLLEGDVPYELTEEDEDYPSPEDIMGDIPMPDEPTE